MKLSILDIIAHKHNCNIFGISSENHNFRYSFLLHINYSPAFLMFVYSKIKEIIFKELKVP